MISFLLRREIAVAGIVDQDIDPAEALLRRRDTGVDLRTVADVEREPQDPALVALAQILERLRRTRRRHHIIAETEGPLRQKPPESARTAGDEPGSHK